MVRTNYFTKWIEEEDLSKITESRRTNFIRRNVIFRYKIPYALVIDNRKQFDNNKFKDFYKNIGKKIKVLYISAAVSK